MNTTTPPINTNEAELPNTGETSTRTRIQKTFKRSVRSFSTLEKRIFWFLSILCAVGILGSLWGIHRMFLVEIPAVGGSLTEGVIGAPRFINPLLAFSDVDRDLTTLVYSGLLRATPEGALTGDLAEKYEISENGLTYTFTLKEGLSWHDGKPITSDDVLFTIAKVKDNVLKSPKRASWEGVLAEKADERTVIFSLKQPYAPFLENTTLGIIPEHIWKNVTSEQFGFSKWNIEPVGSGPYRVTHVSKDSSGIPKYYDLKSFKKFILGRPYIADIQIRFYANEEDLLYALQRGEIESVNAIRAEKAWELESLGARAERYVLPRVFGVFFNQSQNPVFAGKPVREALNEALDRDTIIQTVLFGYAQPLYGPLPPGALGFTVDSSRDERETASSTAPLEKARAVLEKAGWKKNPQTNILEKKTGKKVETLKFSIATSDAEELKNAATRIQEMWGELGAHVDLKIFNTGDLNQNVIRPRKYDALFFGEIVGRESDPFAFWHSSQRNDPGLNIALYTNISADKLLEKGRVSFDREEREKIYKEFEAEVKKDVPSIFVYSPDFIYILPERLKGINSGTIAVPSERFLDIHLWYIETEKVWKIFAKK